MSAVREDKLTNLLALVWALLDQRAVVPEQVLLEELVEVVLRGVFIIIDLDGKLLAEHQGVCEGALYGREPTQHHCHEGVKSGKICA